MAEKTIKAIKAFYEKRKKHNTGKDWKHILKEAVVSYNEVHVHRATKMTPEAAREPTNKVEVKENLEKTRVITRRYPKLVIGSKVRLFHKKDALGKERIPVWSDTISEVVDLKKGEGQTFYKINDNKAKYYMRHELHKITSWTLHELV